MEEAQTSTAAQESGLDKSALAKVVVAALLALVFIVFAIQNTASVDVDFLAWSFGMRRIILMLLSAAIGIAVWELASLLWRRRRRA